MLMTTFKLDSMCRVTQKYYTPGHGNSVLTPLKMNIFKGVMAVFYHFLNFWDTLYYLC